MNKEIDKRKLAIEFHKALGFTCRAGSDDYGYLVSWGGMPEYDENKEACLYFADSHASENNIDWSFGWSDGVYFCRYGESLSESDNATISIMQAVIALNTRTKQSEMMMSEDTNPQWWRKLIHEIRLKFMRKPKKPMIKVTGDKQEKIPVWKIGNKGGVNKNGRDTFSQPH